jgi:hypothetical protein
VEQRAAHSATRNVATMLQLPYLVERFEIPAVYSDQLTTHEFIEYSSTSRYGNTRTEVWKRGQKIGRGTFGDVYKEECISGRSKGSVRAVKTILLNGQSVRSGMYIQELGTIARFSQEKVTSNVLPYSIVELIQRSLVIQAIRSVYRLV